MRKEATKDSAPNGQESEGRGEELTPNSVNISHLLCRLEYTKHDGGWTSN